MLSGNMNESEIIAAIEAQAEDYSYWLIGITGDPDRRKTEHNNPRSWKHWRADSETVARAVEKHFLDAGMNGAAGGNERRPNYVYILLTF